MELRTNRVRINRSRPVVQIIAGYHKYERILCTSHVFPLFRKKCIKYQLWVTLEITGECFHVFQSTGKIILVQVSVEDTTNGQWYGVLLGGRSTAYLKITILETEAADSSNGFKEVSVLVDNNSQYPLAMSN